MEFSLQKPTDKQFDVICEFIKQYELDNRDLKKEQFIIAVNDQELLGFGRMRQHADCMELCSLGVVTSYRGKGIGKAIVEELVRNTKGAIYLVCIIPGFFEPLGFSTVEQYPASVKNKISYCTQELAVPETYVGMKFQTINL